MSSYSNAPDLDHTDERQAALRRYHILDTAPEKNFDRITSLVAKICEVPTALISLIDKERQWFKSCFGFNARETGIGVSFCVHAVHQGEMLVVEDATKDPRFKDNPIVTGPPNLRFYAGAPLTTPEGIHIGSLCIIDYRPRVFDAAQREILETLADVVVNEFESRSAEAQVRQLVDENPQPMYVYAQRDGRILRANPAACELYGYAANDFASLHIEDLRASSTGHQHEGVPLAVHRRSDDSPIPLRLRKREVLFDGYEAVLAVCEVPARDAPNALSVMVDRKGTVRLVYGEQAIDGLDAERLVGSNMTDLIGDADQEAVSDDLSTVLAGDAPSCTRSVTLAGDPVQEAEVSVHPMHNTHDAPVAAFISLTQIREPAAPDAREAGEPDVAINTPSAPLPDDAPALDDKPKAASDEAAPDKASEEATPEKPASSEADTAEATENGDMRIVPSSEDSDGEASETDEGTPRATASTGDDQPSVSEVLKRARAFYSKTSGGSA